MLYFFGFGNRYKAEEGCGNEQCSICNMNTGAHLAKKYFEFSLFFVPLIRAGTKYYIDCDRCGNSRQITKCEYKARKQEFLERLKTGNFPDEMVKSEFAPENVKLGLKTFLLALAILVAAALLVVAVTFVASLFADKSGFDVTVPIFVAILLGLGFLVVRAAYKSFATAKKCARLYNARGQSTPVV